MPNVALLLVPSHRVLSPILLPFASETVSPLSRYILSHEGRRGSLLHICGMEGGRGLRWAPICSLVGRPTCILLSSTSSCPSLTFVHRVPSTSATPLEQVHTKVTGFRATDQELVQHKKSGSGEQGEWAWTRSHGGGACVLDRGGPCGGISTNRRQISDHMAGSRANTTQWGDSRSQQEKIICPEMKNDNWGILLHAQ